MSIDYAYQNSYLFCFPVFPFKPSGKAMPQTVLKKSAKLKAAFFLLLAVCLSPLVFARATSADDALVETGGAAKLDAKRAVPDEIKLISYNMRWRGGDDLRALIKLLKEDKELGGAAVIGLQEVDRDKERTNHTNTARLMAEELGMNYAWAAPPPPPTSAGKERVEEETGVAILSLYPLTDVARIVLPNEGPKGRKRVALGATVHLGGKTLRVYSVHAETRISNEKKIEQLAAVIDDLQTHHAQIKNAVILGDFNTLMPKDIKGTVRLFAGRGFQTPFSIDDPTWKTFVIELKLDWMWLRGLDVKTFGIDRQVSLSDHWPLWAVVRLRDGRNDAK
ncbi:MAG TPA: endonuclease/exonuclease/phosphatase family protein [Pyrinomonadaceae bacterium]